MWWSDCSDGSLAGLVGVWGPGLPEQDQTFAHRLLSPRTHLPRLLQSHPQTWGGPPPPTHTHRIKHLSSSERIQPHSSNPTYFCPGGGAIEPKYFCCTLMYCYISPYMYLFVWERDVSASSSDSPEPIVKPLKASVPEAVSLITGFRNTLSAAFQFACDSSIWVSFFVLSCSLPLSHQSCLNSSCNSLVRYFFLFFFIWGALLSSTLLAALLWLTLWRQVVNQKANFCCHCSHLSSHCCVWGPWHFKPQSWIKHVCPIL